MTDKLQRSDAEWRAMLDPMQYQVTRHAATEPEPKDPVASRARRRGRHQLRRRLGDGHRDGRLGERLPRSRAGRGHQARQAGHQDSLGTARALDLPAGEVVTSWLYDA